MFKWCFWEIGDNLEAEEDDLQFGNEDGNYDPMSSGYGLISYGAYQTRSVFAF